ncbi:MAG TPA: DNA primase [Spirochaetota bacterium]|nr:DNA primase [Spirochaetota bacterium]HPH02020.1 DNA primase [Spirochaetota bacterium]
MVSPEVIERIREALPLVEFIGRDVALKRAGSIYKGLCPFHNERTPSFAVYPEKNRYYCFGCGKKGDVFDYVQERNHLGFGEALVFLADASGIELPSDNPAENAQAAIHRRWMDLYEKATTMYRHALKVLPAGKSALAYLEGRGVRAETIDDFRLGYALPQWDALSSKLLREQYEAETLVECGLSRASREGRRIYDYFRDRVMFPIADERGRVVAFGGRVLDGSEPKYLNSPESPVFKKREILYGLDRARTAIGDKDLAIIVEGYLDVIGLHQAGFSNVVAPLGTALTSWHLNRLKKLTSHIIFLFDGDKAGRRAAFAAARPAMEAGCLARVVLLPSELDAFDISLKHTREQIEALLRQSIPLADFVINTIYQGSEVDSGDRPMMFLQGVYQFLEGMEDGVQTSLFLQKASLLAGVDSDEVELDFRRQRQKPVMTTAKKMGPAPAPVAKFGQSPAGQDGDFELYLMRLAALHSSAWPDINKEIGKGLRIEDSRARSLLEIISSIAGDKTVWSAADVLARVSPGEIRSILEEDMASGRLEIDWQKQFGDTIDTLWIKTIRRERALLDDEMRRQKLLGDDNAIQTLQQEILVLRRREDDLARRMRTVRRETGNKTEGGQG